MILEYTWTVREVALIYSFLEDLGILLDGSPFSRLNDSDRSLDALIKKNIYLHGMGY